MKDVYHLRGEYLDTHDTDLNHPDYSDWLENRVVGLELTLTESCTNYEEAQIIKDEKIKELKKYNKELVKMHL